MKKFIYINCALLIFALSVFGQTSKRDLEQLRKEIGLPASVSISRSKTPLPESKSLKIFLTIKHNKGAAKDFINWVDEWNSRNSNQYGQLQIVDNIDEADIAAVQYQFGTTHYAEEEAVRMQIGKVSSQDKKNEDKIVLGSLGNSNIKSESSVKVLRLPLYTYLVARGQNSSWLVNYARVDELVSDEDQFPERLLQSAIENKLKNR